jgi:hypothetical protein
MPGQAHLSKNLANFKEVYIGLYGTNLKKLYDKIGLA